MNEIINKEPVKHFKGQIAEVKIQLDKKSEYILEMWIKPDGQEWQLLRIPSLIHGLIK